MTPDELREIRSVLVQARDGTERALMGHRECDDGCTLKYVYRTDLEGLNRLIGVLDRELNKE